MSELSPEEKKKIFEEEKTRIEAQERVRKQIDKKKTKPATIGCLALIILIVLVVIINSLKPPSEQEPKAPPKPLYIALNASVIFTGTQFEITNNDNFSWSNVKLEINPGLLKSGYKLNVRVMSAGNTYTVGAMQFAKPDGTRFNPFSMKAQSISIYCNTSKGDGSYHGSWK